MLLTPPPAPPHTTTTITPTRHLHLHSAHSFVSSPISSCTVCRGCLHSPCPHSQPSHPHLLSSSIFSICPLSSSSFSSSSSSCSFSSPPSPSVPSSLFYLPRLCCCCVRRCRAGDGSGGEGRTGERMFAAAQLPHPCTSTTAHSQPCTHSPPQSPLRSAARLPRPRSSFSTRTLGQTHHPLATVVSTRHVGGLLIDSTQSHPPNRPVFDLQSDCCCCCRYLRDLFQAALQLRLLHPAQASLGKASSSAAGVHSQVEADGMDNRWRGVGEGGR